MRQLQKENQAAQRSDCRRNWFSRVLILRTLWKTDRRVPEETQASSCVDGRAVGGIAYVVPDCCTISVSRDGVHVITKEFQKEVILAGATRVAGRAVMQLRPAARRSTSADVRVLHHTNQASRTCGVVAQWCSERVIHEVGVCPMWRDGDGGAIAAIASRLGRRGSRPGVSAVGRVT